MSGGADDEAKPKKSFLIFAILMAVLFPPFGFVALCFSIKTIYLYQSGDFERSRQASSISQMWCKMAAVFFVMLIVAGSTFLLLTLADQLGWSGSSRTGVSGGAQSSRGGSKGRSRGSGGKGGGGKGGKG